MNKLLLFFLNILILTTPVCAIYLYFKLTIPKIKVKKTELNVTTFEKEINEKLYTDYSTLTRFFEEPEKAIEQKKGNLSTLLEKYQLIGIIAGSKENSKAIIKNKATNKQSLLKLGNILEGAILIDISFEKSNVTFEKDGEQYVMEMTKLPPGVQVATIAGRAIGKDTQSSKLSTLNVKKGDWEGKKPEEVIKIEKDQYTENLYYTDSNSVEYIKGNLYKLAGEMYIRPVFTDNAEKLLGIRIEQIKNDSVFKKVGLQPSDILTKINDNDLNSIQQITKLFYSKELYDSKELKFYILRDGKEIKVQVKVNDK